MRFYVAGLYGRRAEFARCAAWLTETFGWESVAHWIELPEDDIGPEDPASKQSEAAITDLESVDQADVVFAFTEAPGMPGAQRGGRHVELGYAIAKGTPVLIIGPYENIFCAMCPRFDTLDQAAAYLASSVEGEQTKVKGG